MRPSREEQRNRSAAYFVSTQSAGRKPFFRHERWALLLRETILHYSEKDYSLHAFVIMPDHVHLLLVPEKTVERAVQMIKGGFSFKAKREFAWTADIWQPGFTDHRIRDEEDWSRHIEYIQRNPVRAGLVGNGEVYPYSGFPDPAFPQGLKPRASILGEDVRAKARTLPAKARTLPAKARTLQAKADALPAKADALPAEAGALQAEAGALQAKADALQVEARSLHPENADSNRNEVDQ